MNSSGLRGERETVTSGHFHVRDHGLEIRVYIEDGERLLGILGFIHGEPSLLKDVLEAHPDQRFVVHDKHPSRNQFLSPACSIAWPTTEWT